MGGRTDGRHQGLRGRRWKFAGTLIAAVFAPAGSFAGTAAADPTPYVSDGKVGTVRAIAVGSSPADSGEVYVGGSFQKIANQSFSYLAALTSGGAVDTTWSGNPQVTADVYSLALLPVTVKLVDGQSYPQ